MELRIDARMDALFHRERRKDVAARAPELDTTLLPLLLRGLRKLAVAGLQRTSGSATKRARDQRCDVLHLNISCTSPACPIGVILRRGIWEKLRNNEQKNEQLRSRSCLVVGRV